MNLFELIEEELIQALIDDPSLPFSTQLQIMTSAIKITKENLDKQQIVIRKLESWLSTTFPGCQLQPFGSSVMGLGCIDSDLDLNLKVIGFESNKENKSIFLY